MMKNIFFANKISREIASQVKTFEKTLSPNEQVGIVIGGNIIAIKEIIALFEFELIVIQGLCKTASPPLTRGAPVRVGFEPTLQSLTLTSVPRTEEELRSLIDFSIQGQESSQG